MILVKNHRKRIAAVLLTLLFIVATIPRMLSAYVASEPPHYINENDEWAIGVKPVPGPLPGTTDPLEFAAATNLSEPIQQVLEILEIPPDVSLDQSSDFEPEIGRRRPPERMITAVGKTEINFSLDNGANFTICESTGELIFYDSGDAVYFYTHGRRRGQPEFLKTPLSRTQFMDRVNDLLNSGNLFGTKDGSIAVAVNDGLVELVPADRPLPGPHSVESTSSTEEDVKVWRFAARKTYKDYEFLSHYPRGNEVSIEVDSQTGKTIRITNSSLVLPDNASENISQEQALQIAQSFGKTRGIASDAFMVRKLITHPTNGWTMEGRGKVGWLPITKLCWVVTWCYLQPNKTTMPIGEEPSRNPESAGRMYFDTATCEPIRDPNAYIHEGPYVYIDIQTGSIAGGWNGEKWEP